MNNTYAPLVQQNQTAYQLVIAYTALAQHAGKLANFTASYLQAYNKQITNATALVTDPFSRPIIPDVDIPIAGGYRIPAGGSGTSIASSQGATPPSQTPNYILSSPLGNGGGLTQDELTMVIFGIIVLLAYGGPLAAGIAVSGVNKFIKLATTIVAIWQVKIAASFGGYLYGSPPDTGAAIVSLIYFIVSVAWWVISQMDWWQQIMSYALMVALGWAYVAALIVGGICLLAQFLYYWFY